MAGERILVVDDGKENRDFIVEYVLEPNGFEPIVARDGQEGLEMARQHRPDLILLDLQMPRMTGLEMLDAMNAERLDIPVILMTFHGSEEIAVEVYRKGVRDYVKKPYTVEEMEGAIERSIGEARLRHQKDELTDRLIERNTELNQRVRELNVLYNIGKSVTALMDIDALMMRIAESATQITSAEETAVFLVQNETLICKAISQQTIRQTFAVNEVRSDPLAERSIQLAQSVILTPEQIANMRRNNPSAPSAAMATPLLIGTKAVGVLVVKNFGAEARHFTQNDVALLSALADYGAIAYANASEHAKAEHSQQNDPSEWLIKRSVSEAIYQKIKDDADLLKGTGHRYTVSVLTAEIVGHQRFAEKAPPEQVTNLLNEYWDLLAKVVYQFGGMISHQDAETLTALFNVPIQVGNHHQQVVKAAALLRDNVAALHQERGGGLKFKVGLHCGEAVVGYMGTSQAQSFTAVGEAINTARLIRRVPKAGQVIVSEALGRQIIKYAHLRPVGKMPLGGAKKQILLLEMLSLKEDVHKT